MARSTLLALPLAFPVALAAASAQVGPGGPPAPTRADYALTNVRIVTAPGKVIERGTVVVRDGRIAAVGPQVTVPNDVVRMDLSGHSVYPGLIDAATSIGLPSPTRTIAAPAIPEQESASVPCGRSGSGGEVSDRLQWSCRDPPHLQEGRGVPTVQRLQQRYKADVG